MLLANCRPSGQRILALHPPEAVLFTHSSRVCGSPRKSFSWYLFALSTAAVFLKKKKKNKERKETGEEMTGLPDYIDSSTVKSPGFRGHADYVFLLSR